MIKGNAVRVYYPVIQSSTGERITGDSANHTVYIAQGAVLSVLDVTPTELVYSSNGTTVATGEYTFEVPASYTNTDRLVIIVKSSNTNYSAVIPPIELEFDAPEVHLDTTSIQAIVDGLLGASIAAGDAGTFQSIIYSLINAVTKIDSYPAYSNLELGVETKEAIADEVLSHTVTPALCSSMNTLAGMLMGGFMSEMDTEQNTWTVKKPDGTAFFQKKFETSDNLKPISKVYNV